LTYNVAICALCTHLMTNVDVQQSVYWLPKLEWGLSSMFVYDIVPDFRFAHQRCWQRLKPKRQKSIRRCCEKRYEPRCLEQQV